MAATPFKATLQFKCIGSGRIFSHRMTMSDVTTEFGVFQDGGTTLQLPSNEGNVVLFDILLSAAGVDTTQAEIYVNSKDTGVIMNNPACVGTVIQRQFASAPMAIGAGSQIRFKQLA